MNSRKDILVKILLRLTVKRIFVCKSVCKSWYDLISDPEFAKLHFDQAEVCPLLQSAKLLHLVQPEISDFGLDLGLCDRSYSRSNVNSGVESIFKLPSNRCSVINSCNGFLLLWFLSPCHNEFLSVCNPITGEVIYLPEIRTADKPENIRHGFGFSSMSNRYKVIRMIRCGGSTSRVEVNVLGTESWKELGLMTLSIFDTHPTYLNGFLYWTCDYSISRIVSFDVEKECFRSIKGVDDIKLYKNVKMGALGQELCVSGFLRYVSFHVWVMKDHCGEKVWSQVFSIVIPCYKRWLEGPLRPVKYLNDRSLLMVRCFAKSLICLDLRKNAIRNLKIRGIKSPDVDPISFNPSFVTLKHALSRLEEKVNKKVLTDTMRFAEIESQYRDIKIILEDFSDYYKGFNSDSDETDKEVIEELSQEIISRFQHKEFDADDGNDKQEFSSEDRDENLERDRKDVDHNFEPGNRDEDLKFNSSS